MKRYRSYTAKKHKLPRRIIFFCVVAVLIFVITVIVGNVLKSKLETTPRDTSDVLTTTSPEENKPQGDKPKDPEVLHDEALAGVCAGCLDLTAVDGTEAAAKAVEAIKAKGFNAVSFTVTDGEGKVTYASPAIEKFSRLPASEALITYEELSAAAKAAKNSNMRLCAVITASDSICDELIAAELYSLGFAEICVRGFEEYTQFDNETVSEVCGYVERLRAAAGDMVFSLSFDSLFFKAPSNAPYIEKIYAKTEFFAIDMTECDGESAKALSEEIAGSFTAYLLRPLLSGADEELVTSVNEALGASGVKARQYLSAPAPVTSEDTAD